MTFNNGGLCELLPADLAPGPDKTCPERPWYIVTQPPAFVREQFIARTDQEPPIGPMAGYFDHELRRTTWYALYWTERRRWCAVDLRGAPHICRSDNGQRRRVFHRFDRVVLYVKERHAEPTPGGSR